MKVKITFGFKKGPLWVAVVVKISKDFVYNQLENLQVNFCPLFLIKLQKG